MSIHIFIFKTVENEYMNTHVTLSEGFYICRRCYNWKLPEGHLLVCEKLEV